MRAMMLLLGSVMLASTAHAVPYDRATVRLARVEPLLAVPAAPSAQTAPVAVPPRRERTS